MYLNSDVNVQIMDVHWYSMVGVVISTPVNEIIAIDIDNR